MFVIEFGPVGVFFLTYYLTDFFTAALALGLATLITLILSKVINKRVPWFAIFSGTVTIATSLVTYLYTEPGILIFKDTVYYTLFASFIGIGLWRGRSVFEKFFGHIFAITEKGWFSLERRWVFFFMSAAVSNELVRMFLTVEQWVIYKQIILVIFVVFGMYQLRVTMRYRTEEADKWGLRRIRIASLKNRKVKQ